MRKNAFATEKDSCPKVSGKRVDPYAEAHLTLMSASIKQIFTHRKFEKESTSIDDEVDLNGVSSHYRTPFCHTLNSEVRSRCEGIKEVHYRAFGTRSSRSNDVLCTIYDMSDVAPLSRQTRESPRQSLMDDVWFE